MPRLMLMSGPPGVGKSTLAIGIAKVIPIVLLDKDLIDEPFSPGKRDHHYSAEIEPKVLRALLSLAQLNLQCGRDVMMDLPWTHILLNDGTWVDAIRSLAQTTGAQLTVLECVISTPALKQRLAARGLARDQEKLTSAGWDAFVRRDCIGATNPLPHHTIDLERYPTECLQHALQILAG